MISVISDSPGLHDFTSILLMNLPIVLVVGCYTPHTPRSLRYSTSSEVPHNLK